jgi:hypothetical protein
MRASARRWAAPESVSVFRNGGARTPAQAMIAFTDDHRDLVGESR